MIRERLPNRRASELLDFEHDRVRYTGSISRFGDGRIAEMFLDGRKTTNSASNLVRESAIAASLAFQHGCPAATLSDALDRTPGGEGTGPLAKFLDLINSTAAPRPGCAGDGGDEATSSPELHTDTPRGIGAPA